LSVRDGLRVVVRKMSKEEIFETESFLLKAKHPGLRSVLQAHLSFLKKSAKGNIPAESPAKPAVQSSVNPVVQNPAKPAVQSSVNPVVQSPAKPAVPEKEHTTVVPPAAPARVEKAVEQPKTVVEHSVAADHHDAHHAGTVNHATEPHLKTGGEALEFQDKPNAIQDLSSDAVEVFQELKIRRKHRFVVYKLGDSAVEGASALCE
jgi:hypothetical protein